MSLKDRAKRLKSAIPVVFLALKNKKTPWYAKMFAAITVAYALSPIDLVPDFIPILGYLDDVMICRKNIFDCLQDIGLLALGFVI